jgi:hypothetical protein
MTDRKLPPEIVDLTKELGDMLDDADSAVATLRFAAAVATDTAEKLMKSKIELAVKLRLMGLEVQSPEPRLEVVPDIEPDIVDTLAQLVRDALGDFSHSDAPEAWEWLERAEAALKIVGPVVWECPECDSHALQSAPDPHDDNGRYYLCEDCNTWYHGAVPIDGDPPSSDPDQ